MKTDYSQVTNSDQPTDYKEIAKFAGKLLLLSSIIVNTKEQDNLFITASIISLVGGSLLVRSAFLEAEEQQIAPGETTFANKLKIIGTTGNIIFSFILFIALIIEVSIKQQPTFVAQTPVSGSVGVFY